MKKNENIDDNKNINENINRNKNHKIGYTFAVFSALCYAIQVIIGKVVLEKGFHAFDLLLIQYTCTTIILGIFLLCRRDKNLFLCSKKEFSKITLQGIIGSVGTSLLIYLAMERINAGIASMLLYLCPVFVCLFFMITGIRKVSLANRIAVVLSFLGAFLALNIFQLKDAPLSIIGIALGIGSGITYAFYNIFVDIKLRDIKTETLLFYMYVIGTLVIFIINFNFFIHPPHIKEPTIFILIAISGLFQVMPMALLNLAIRSIGSSKTSIIITAELPFTIILAYLILGEVMVPLQILGIILIVSSILMIQFKKE